MARCSLRAPFCLLSRLWTNTDYRRGATTSYLSCDLASFRSLRSTQVCRIEKRRAGRLLRGRPRRRRQTPHTFSLKIRYSYDMRGGFPLSSLVSPAHLPHLSRPPFSPASRYVRREHVLFWRRRTGPARCIIFFSTGYGGRPVSRLLLPVASAPACHGPQHLQLVGGVPGQRHGDPLPPDRARQRGDRAEHRGDGRPAVRVS